MLRVLDIPAELPFLDCLAEGVLHALPAEAPEQLAQVTILLPTRRSARALRLAFLKAAKGRALLLPRMRALAGLSTEDADELALPTLLDLPPAVDALRRQAVLAGYIAQLPQRHGGPGTAEQAWAMAGELARLLDEMALEERDLALVMGADPQQIVAAWLHRLEALVPEQHAQHWQITTSFLRGVFAEWQGWLARQGLLDIGLRRVQALRAQTRAWQQNPPQAPVIAAGIGVGGTIPAAAELLRVVAGLPQGQVVLHGVMGEVEEKLWDAIGSAPTHPFCGQQRLLQALDVRPEDVKRWPACRRGAAIPPERPALLGMALRPAAGLPAWQQRRPDAWRPALHGLTQLTAPDAQQEAVAIALLLRGALEVPQARAALVTPDRDLAQRVSAELARHGIVADDSAGRALAETPAGAFLRLIARCAAAEFAPVPLLSVLKHPSCAGGWDRTDWMGAVRMLDKRVLRGPRPGAGLAGLRAASREAFRREEDAAPVQALLERLETCFEGFTRLPASPALPPADLLAAQLSAAEALAGTRETPGGLRLYEGEEGEALAQHLAALQEALRNMGPIAPSEWPALLDAALAGAAAPALHASRGRASGPHPRVEILGLLEARLLTFDLVVLGALDESVWPLATDPGPWMSRPMRRDFGLPEPEARIGRVAADFVLSACAAPTAVLSRAAKRGGSPTVPARWLTRIETFLAGQNGLRLEPSPAAAWAAQLDQPAQVSPCARPAPVPPREARPDEISVTQVETLIADPYAFYAQKVLGLRPLDPLDAELGAAEYGTLVHGALHRFIRRLDKAGGVWPGEDAAAQWFHEAAEQALEDSAVRPGFAAYWRPRLDRIGAWVREREAEVRQGGAISRSLTELKGSYTLRHDDGREVRLTARADRIDIAANGTLHLLDYKTGTLPSGKAVEEGHKPQLTLEAAIALKGGFPDIREGGVAALTYWRVTGGPEAGKDFTAVKGGQEIATLADAHLLKLRELVDRFLWGSAPFTARPHPAREPAGKEYDHLSRIAEWASAEDAGGEA